MASKKILFVFFLVYFNQVESATLIERSYEYVMNFGKNLAPSFMSFLDCLAEDDAWTCAKLKAGTMLDGWNEDLNKQRALWQDAADAEIRQSGRSFDEMPSKIGQEVESSLNSVMDLVQHSVARAYSRKHGGGGGIETITISASNDKKKHKKKKPTKVQVVQVMEKMQEKGREAVQSWVLGHAAEVDMKVNPNASTGEGQTRTGRGLLDDAWAMGEKALDSVAEHVLESENVENGLQNVKSSFEEQRGKKKKKKKAILKLLLLGAVLKAKIATLLQILSFKLQVKFFIIALLGLAINLARFWIDLKKTHQQPQKVIYYEHAQHQHHYDEHEEPGWGPWSRSMEPEAKQENDMEIDLDNSPYRAQERKVQFVRPALS